MNDVLIKFENLKNKQPLKALHLIMKALNEEPDNYDYLMALGNHFNNIQKFDEAIKYFERAQKIDVLDYKSSFAFGISLMNKSKFREAVKQFDSVKDAYPEAYYNSALSYIRMNEVDKAIQQARYLVDHEILGKEALRLIIDICIFSDDQKNKEIELERYYEKYGKDDYYHFLKAREAYFDGMFLESAYHYSKISSGEIERYRYITEYADTLVKIKRYDKALPLFQELILVDKPTEAILFQYIEVLYQLKMYTEILDVLNDYKFIIRNKAKISEIRSKLHYKMHLE